MNQGYIWTALPKTEDGEVSKQPMRFDTFAEKVSRRMQVCEWAISQEGQSYSSHSRTRLLSLPASLRVDVFLDAGYVYDREFEWRWGWCGACETCLFWMNHLRWDIFHGMLKMFLRFFIGCFIILYLYSHLICKGKNKEYIYNIVAFGIWELWDGLSESILPTLSDFNGKRDSMNNAMDWDI